MKFELIMESFRSFLSERTLYHGTVIDAVEGIKQHGLLPDVGDWVSNSYGTDYDDIEPLVFAADKKTLGSAVGAMRYHIGQKLNKNLTSVTEEDIRRHGALVIINEDDPEWGEPDSLAGFEHVKPYDERGWHDEYPVSAEPGDYISRDEPFIHKILVGNGLMRFLKYHDQIPLKHSFGNDSAKIKKMREKVIEHYVNIKGPQYRERIVSWINSKKPETIKRYYKEIENK